MVGTNNHWIAFYDSKKLCTADILLQKLSGKNPDPDLNEYQKSSVVDGAFEYTAFFPKLGDQNKWLKITAADLRDSNAILLTSSLPFPG